MRTRPCVDSISTSSPTPSVTLVRAPDREGSRFLAGVARGQAKAGKLVVWLTCRDPMWDLQPLLEEGISVMGRPGLTMNQFRVLVGMVEEGADLILVDGLDYLDPIECLNQETAVMVAEQILLQATARHGFQAMATLAPDPA